MDGEQAGRNDGNLYRLGGLFGSNVSHEAEHDVPRCENPSHTFSKDDLQMIMGRDTKNDPKQVLNYKYDLYLLWCLIKIQNNPIMICTL